MTQISVLVVDGQRTFADALASRLAVESGLVVAAAVESASAARRVLVGRHIDVVLLDSELTDGLDLVAELADTRTTATQPVRVIMLGKVPDARHMVAALRAGIAGWVPKEESIELLVNVIRGVMSDLTWLPAAAVGPVLRLLLREDYGWETSSKRPTASLTPRELEVLSYLAEGFGRREVAEHMHVSTHTVRSHLQNLMGKLGVHTALEAVALARQAQLGGGHLGHSGPEDIWRATPSSLGRAF